MEWRQVIELLQDEWDPPEMFEPEEYLEAISAVRGKKTSRAALLRASRRYAREQFHDRLCALMASSSTRIVTPDKVKPRLLTLPTQELVGKKHLIIPDTQVKPGVPVEHFKWIGKYIADKRPDVVIHLGDHWDMPSLSSYDSPVRKTFEGRCKKDDIDAGNYALELLENELEKANFQPEHKILLEGNHDGFAPQGRLGRYLRENPTDRGLITPEMFIDQELGWTRIPFLDQILIDEILYAHLFPYTTKGTTTAGSIRMGAASAQAQLKAVMRSCTAGHKQGLDWAMQATPLGTYRSVIAGSCYMHDEEYLGPGNHYWRGILVKHDVRPGGNPNHYDLMEVSLEFLKRWHNG